MSKCNGKPSKKGTGFEQPLAAHQHWHIDVSYINISGTFYYLCSILDRGSRYIVSWDLRESMTEADIEIILERAKELHPEARQGRPNKSPRQMIFVRDGRVWQPGQLICPDKECA